MYSLELDPGGRPGLDRDDGIGNVGTANTFEHRTEALGSLGVPRPSKMFEVSRMGGEQHGHAARRYLPGANSELPFHS
jgi:hypothetical protein